MIGLIEGPMKFLEKFGVPVKYLLAVLGVGIITFAFFFFDFSASIVFEYMVGTAPIWAPMITFLLFFEAWLYYVQTKFRISKTRVSLEIKLPQDVFKSPEAMELVLQQLYQTASPDNHLDTYLNGKHPPIWGLEIVSRGGDVRFYINTQRQKFKNLVETQLYAQYPSVEITELDIDYTAEIPWDTSRFDYFSIHFGLKKADAYPIKTYIDYGLKDMPKEEEKIDPITTVLETLGNIGPGEYIWIQILADAHREVTFKEGALFKRPDWKAEARTEIEKIVEDGRTRAGETAAFGMIVQTETERDTIKAIERSLGKVPFNVAIRAMYIATKESYLPGERIGAIITMWKAFDDLNRNSIGFRWRTDFDWNMWQDPSGKKRLALKEKELDEYKRRVFTPRTVDEHPKVMTTEELATIFHLPGRVASTPSLSRLPSKRAEAPSNLPT